MISLVPFLIGSIAAGATDPTSHLVVESCEFGEMYAFNSSECDIALENNGDKPIRVFDAKPSAADDAVSPAEEVVAPHSIAYLKFKVSSGNAAGSVRHFLHFRTDESGNAERKAAAFGFVMTVLDDPRSELDLGVVDTKGAPVSKSIEVVSSDTPDFRVSSILEAPPWLDASLGADGRSLTANVKPDAGWGLHAGFVKLAINTQQQKQAWISVKADIHGDVVPASNPYDLGLLRIGGSNEFHIPLRSRSRKPFQVGKVELEGIRGNVELGQCEKNGGDCRMLILKIAEQQPGALSGKVWIELPELHQRLNLAVWGLLVPQEMKVRKFEDMQSASGNAASSEGAGATIDLERAVKSAVNSAPAVAPPGNGPLLKWTIANGSNIHGFQIFRGGSENGPFALLNPATIPSTAQSEDSVNYQWRDTSARTGETYWYYIGIVYKDGRKQNLTGPQKVVAK
jgi:hypothetical protein